MYLIREALTIKSNQIKSINRFNSHKVKKAIQSACSEGSGLKVEVNLYIDAFSFFGLLWFLIWSMSQAHAAKRRRRVASIKTANQFIRLFWEALA